MKKLKNQLLIAALTIFSAGTVSAQVISIEDARALPEDTEVTVSGVVTNGEEMGVIRYLQDETAGIPAYGSALNDVFRHDSITVTGILKNYNGLLELDPVSEVINHGPAVNPIEPAVIVPNQVNEAFEGQLVQIENAVFADGGSNFAGGSFNFTSNGQSSVIYVNAASPLVGEFIPVGPVTLTGISSQFTFTGFGGYQLLPRDADDIAGSGNLNIISSLDQSNMSESGFTLHWVTDLPSTTEVFYTAYPNEDFTEAAHQSTDESVTAHQIELSGLEAGQIYFVKAFSVAGEDTATSNIGVFATVSNSSGEIKAYFNNIVDHSVASSEENEAVWTSSIADTIASYIDKAMISLDLAIYNTNNSIIISAINDALDRGVDIRFVTEGSNANIGLSSLDNGIDVLQRQNSTSSGMHNKFVVIDAETVNNSWILTGSTNFTPGNLYDDYNNLIAVQDQSLAKAYTLEMNEMWGSNTTVPNAVESKFGPDKSNNTPHNFIVDGKNVELYFSPSDGTTSAIADVLNTADASIEFAVLAFTRDELAELIIQKNNNFFITARGIIEQSNGSGTDYQEMVDNGVEILSHSSIPLQIHHKYVIVDRAEETADPVVLTGSHNWSASAETENDENTLIIYDADHANQYYQEWNARFNGMLTSIEEQTIGFTAVYPNPAKDVITVEFDLQHVEKLNIQIVDITGKIIFDRQLNSYSGKNQLSLDVSSLPAGMYNVVLIADTYKTVEKLMITK